MEWIRINSDEDVKIFFEAQKVARQHACATFIASRGALRVAPFAIQFLEFHPRTENPNATSLIIWPCLLASAVANIMLTDEIKRAARDFTIAFDIHAAFNSDASTHAAVNAAYLVALDFSTELLTETIDQTIKAPSTDMLGEVNRDAQLWAEYSENKADQNPGIVASLWSDENPLERDWQNLRKKLLAADTPGPRGADWSFWVKWYDDILAGNPQNWTMLHEIATTGAIDWDASAREVNDRINQIVERYRLRDEVGALRREVEEARAALANRTPRSHNMPPELVDDTPKIEGRLAVVLAAVQEAETELEKPQPDRSILTKAGQAISDFAIWFMKYCRKKMDFVINTTITTAIKWGVPAAGAVYLTTPQKIIELGAAIRAAAGF